MSSNNHNNTENDQKIQERKEEMQLLSRFKNVITTKLEKMTAETEDKQKAYKMGEHEKKILLEMQGMGLAEGMAAGIATFVLLRRGPIWVGRYVLNRRSNAAMSSKNNNPFHNVSSVGGSGSSTGYQLSNPLNNHSNFPRSRNPIVRAVWFVVDATISLMMAANVSVHFTDLTRIRNDLQDLPLAEGKSLVSDAFCQDLTKELQQIQQEKSPAYQRLVQQYENKHGDNNTGISPLALYMEGITLFSQNCERRAFRQRELFQEQGGNEFGGFDDNDTSTNQEDFHSLSIPPPGVAKDGPRLVRTSTNNDESEEYKVIYDDSDESDNSNNADYWRGS